MIKRIGLLCALNILAVTVMAGVQFEAQTRYVQASLDNKSEPALHISNNSSDFNPYTETAQVTHSSNSGPYKADIFHDSSLLPDHFIFNGLAKTTDPFYHTGSGQLNLSGKSFFEIEFSIFQPCDMLLTGSMDVFFDYGGNGGSGFSETSLQLHRKDGVLINGGNIEFSFTSIFDGYNSLQFSEQRQLTEGTYILSAYSEINADYWFSEIPSYSVGGGGQANCDFDMVITPEPASLLLLTLGGLWIRKRPAK